MHVFCIALSIAVATLNAYTSLTFDRNNTAVIAVRADAWPFVSKDFNSGEYVGFFWDICTEAVHRAGYHFRVQEIDTDERSRFLRTGDGGYDLLCDPTTITLKRVYDLDGKEGRPLREFSPIVFVANGSYGQPERGATIPRASGVLPKDAPKAPTCKEIFAWLDRNKSEKDPAKSKWFTGTESSKNSSRSEDASDGYIDFLEWLQQRFGFTLWLPPKDTNGTVKRFQIWGYVRGTTTDDAFKTPGERKQQNGTINCLKGFRSHKEAADEFCEKKLARYFGDIEIIKAGVADYIKREKKACKIDFTAANEGTYEPYAFLLSSRFHAEFPRLFTQALYGMFQDQTIERLFNGHFPDAKKSQFLETLMRINRIPAGSGTSNASPNTGRGFSPYRPMLICDRHLPRFLCKTIVPPCGGGDFVDDHISGDGKL